MQEPTLEEYPRTPKRKESIKESAERKFTVLLRRVSYDFSRGTSLDPLQNVEEHRIVSRNASIDLDPSLYCLNPQEFETASSSPNKRSSVSATNTFLSSAEQSVKEETASYCFSFANIPLQQQPVDGLTLRDFYGISEVAAGGNAFISRAVMRSNKTEVALKIMKETMQWNAVANSEFTMEFQILQRTNHLNIVRLLGAGRTPLRFLVLEWLGGATLQDRLSAPRKRSSVAEMFFQNAEVNWEETLSIGSQLADAMNYLHNQCHPEATIIHRDLKPEVSCLLLVVQMLYFILK